MPKWLEFRRVLFRSSCRLHRALIDIPIRHLTTQTKEADHDRQGKSKHKNRRSAPVIPESSQKRQKSKLWTLHHIHPLFQTSSGDHSNRVLTLCKIGTIKFMKIWVKVDIVRLGKVHKSSVKSMCCQRWEPPVMVNPVFTMINFQSRNGIREFLRCMFRDRSPDQVQRIDAK